MSERASADRTSPARDFWTAQAWIDGRWQHDVLLRVDDTGHWREVRPGVAAPPPDATVLAGPVLPGMIDAHSHAFQRAFAGLSERRADSANGVDDFWSWRDRMYGVALRIDADQLRAVAAQLYAELLQGGYTQVCEFHYLQHAQDGKAYDDPATLSWALADAAAEAGIGLTVLPVLYERAGFDAPALRHDQRRFRSTPQSVHALYAAVQAARRPLLNAGVAIHSIRAASAPSIEELLRHVGSEELPIHIHIGEQVREVEESIAVTGARPIEWLCREFALDRRWQLVHATHATPDEIGGVAARGAGIVVCPTTEANLGDGLADLPRWLDAGVPLALGSDSQVSRHWVEEMRWLEYGQRLLQRQRNVSATAQQSSTAGRLLERILASEGRSAGFPQWGLVAGARADALVVDVAAPGVHGVPPSHVLDALVFATDGQVFREVYVAGRQVVAEGCCIGRADIESRFGACMASLWSDAGSEFEARTTS
ncbi:MAG: formimidoylglutamate deiminase [Caldimonas sp.]